MILDKLEIK